MAKRMNYKTGLIFVLLAGLFWSLFGVIIRQIQSANTWQILLYRCTSLFILITLFLLIRHKSDFWKVIVGSFRSDCLGGIGLMFALIGSVISVLNTSVANTLFLLSITPFFTALFARLFLQEMVKLSTWIAILVAIVGAMIIFFDEVNLQKSIANLFAIISALGFSIFTIMLRVGKQKDLMPSVWFGSAFTVIISVIVCLIFGYSIVVSIWDMWVSVMLGIFQIGIGLIFYTIGAVVVPASQLALLVMTEVVLGPLWVLIFVGESFSTNTLIGGILLLSAVIFDVVASFRNPNIIK